ncbi:hypothetical protein BDV29DRAFT_177232 [Aspergillus leporis]|uniref:Uncharacterized protein n=1 Tax=Aspergillus leporis TaxID=41062 RepID=A0A5N5WVH5_9EURO|nr:hypothetical protein BDV29DRAFT_177232 [Aspergillus leporis]
MFYAEQVCSRFFIVCTYRYACMHACRWREGVVCLDTSMYGVRFYVPWSIMIFLILCFAFSYFWGTLLGRD